MLLARRRVEDERGAEAAREADGSLADRCSRSLWKAAKDRDRGVREQATKARHLIKQSVRDHVASKLRPRAARAGSGIERCFFVAWTPDTEDPLHGDYTKIDSVSLVLESGDSILDDFFLCPGV